MWTWALDRALTQLFRRGAVEITFPSGAVRRYGEPGPAPIRVRITDPSLPRRLCLDTELALGEGYMDGGIVFEDDAMRDFIHLAVENRSAGNNPALIRWSQRLAAPIQRYLRRNPVRAARRNVAHHYDLSGKLYDLFLDADRQYSCAYFTEPGLSLDAAQEAKKHHIARKLCLHEGDRVLDIGCGWGGMAITLARDYGARVLGITLSEEQHAIATARVREAGLEDRVEIRLQDYRKVSGQFDAIVSVGMFEHVGRPEFDAYFATVARLLKPEGRALIHTIGNQDPPRATSSWIRQYIFPGGYIPAMSEAVASVEHSGMMTLDVEVWRLHYAETLRHWHDRFMARIDEARELYDPRFCRMWRYYLTIAESGFRQDRLCVFQVQLGHRSDAVPITRNYLYPADHCAGYPRTIHAAE